MDQVRDEETNASRASMAGRQAEVLAEVADMLEKGLPDDKNLRADKWKPRQGKC